MICCLKQLKSRALDLRPNYQHAATDGYMPPPAVASRTCGRREASTLVQALCQLCAFVLREDGRVRADFRSKQIKTKA